MSWLVDIKLIVNRMLLQKNPIAPLNSANQMNKAKRHHSVYFLTCPNYITVTYEMSNVKCFIPEIELIQNKYYLWERGSMVGKHLDQTK